MNDRGAVIPEEFMKEAIEYWERRGLVGLVHLTPLSPLTRWQRLRLLPGRIRWAVHDFLFPECQTEDDDR